VVKRFDSIWTCGGASSACDSGMKVRKYGEFVLYDDYLKLENEIYSLRQQARAWDAGTQYGGLVAEIEAENTKLLEIVSRLTGSRK